MADGEFAAKVDWPRVHVFWGDERCVPSDHHDSNYRMARETLLDKVPILPRNVHCIRGELLPQQAAATYQAELEAILGPDGRLDLILLGRGTDGHTASLFPGTMALEEREQSVVAVYVGEPHGEEGEAHIWRDGDSYRKVRVVDNKLVGALLLGERHGSMA